MTTRRLLPRKASLVLSVAKVLVLGLVLLVLVSSLSGQAPTRSTHDSAVLRSDHGARDLQAAMTEHDCTATGFGDTAAPLSALIRHRGQVRHVSFERGWSVFTGKVPGVLLAVCLDELVPERAVSSRA